MRARKANVVRRGAIRGLIKNSVKQQGHFSYSQRSDNPNPGNLGFDLGSGVNLNQSFFSESRESRGLAKPCPLAHRALSSRLFLTELYSYYVSFLIILSNRALQALNFTISYRSSPFPNVKSIIMLNFHIDHHFKLFNFKSTVDLKFRNQSSFSRPPIGGSIVQQIQATYTPRKRLGARASIFCFVFKKSIIILKLTNR